LRLRIHHKELIDKRQKAEDRSKQKRTAVRLNKPETRKPEPGTRNTKPGLRLRMRIPHRWHRFFASKAAEPSEHGLFIEAEEV